MADSWQGIITYTATAACADCGTEDTVPAKPHPATRFAELGWRKVARDAYRGANGKCRQVWVCPKCSQTGTFKA